MKELPIVAGAKKLLQTINSEKHEGLLRSWCVERSGKNRPNYRQFIRKNSPFLWKTINKLANKTYSDSSWNRSEAVRHVVLFLLREIEPRSCSQCNTLFFWGKHCSWSCASRHSAIEKGLGGPLTERSKERRKQTCLEKYGVENPTQLKRVQQKRQQTCVEKYGYEHPLQHPDVFQKHIKSCLKKHTVECVDGKIRTFQSNDEARIVNAMLRHGYVVATPSMSIEYRIDGKVSRYHPDFVVESPKGKKLLIEVKSGYTLLADFKKNLAKFDAANRYCKERGLKFMLCVIQKRLGKETIEKFTFPTKERLEGHTWTTR